MKKHLSIMFPIFVVVSLLTGLSSSSQATTNSHEELIIVQTDVLDSEDTLADRKFLENIDENTNLEINEYTKNDSNLVITDNSNEGIDTFEALLNAIAAADTDNNLTTIKISQDINVTSTIQIESGQNIQLVANGQNVSLFHSMVDTDSVIRIAENATFILGETTDDYIITVDANEIGKGELIYNLGNFYLNKGIVRGAIGGDESKTGGGVYNGGYFEMNGGSIQDNIGYGLSGANGGGGIYNIGEFVMNNGSISRNFTGLPADFESSIGLGGGIFVRNGSITLRGGEITDNAAGSGGGVYIYGISNIAGQYGTATFGNGLITENSATLQGGGVWLCQTGELSSYVNDTMSVVGNTVAVVDDYRVGGDDYYSEGMTGDYSVSLPRVSILGDAFTYYRDDPAARYSLSTTPNPISVDDLDFSDLVYLHAEVANAAALKSEAKLLISGNKAREGGGVANNGIVNFGYESTSILLNLTAEKLLTGKELTADQFSFELIDSTDTVIETVQNDADGIINFSELEYTTSGVYEYTIREVNDEQPNITYDDHELKVTVTVTEENGELTAAAAYEGEVVFSNSYTSTAANIVLQSRKLLTGKELTADQFSFELIDSTDTVIETVQNDADGIINFSELEYTTSGVYEYTIREVNDGQPNITYDDHELKVTVAVTEENGELTAATAYEGEVVFSNSYTSTAANIVLQSRKLLTGKELTADQFSFELIDSTDTVIETVQNDADGIINFSELEYTTSGVYEYTIREVNDEQPNITYDDHELKVTVAVTEENGELTAAAAYEGEVVFSNSYANTTASIVLQSRKLLTGKELTADQFSFELIDSTDTVIETVQNDADGIINFSELEYTTSGVYEYTIREVNDEQPNITYDDHEIKVTVTVTEENEGLITTVDYKETPVFTNNYQTTSNSQPDEASESTVNQVQDKFPSTGTIANFFFLLTGIISVCITLIIWWRNNIRN
ncbi:Spy0128 family protein [Enterococcus sp. CWB-B31]|uniref:Spy0128 family protein n=1 Tax=Enterococcus sp. CWB-B31 TaxID=2885159 RepID=UPI001E4CC43B|nr:FctA domain-containing protein [Enterococcus sp. CWB-B31]MCB5953519.1 hypothetical protein [Enterococcus sp. CWB-B31]